MRKLIAIIVFVLIMGILIPVMSAFCLFGGILDIIRGDSPFDKDAFCYLAIKAFIKGLESV